MEEDQLRRCEDVVIENSITNTKRCRLLKNEVNVGNVFLIGYGVVAGFNVGYEYSSSV
jgi:hypothetical protein